MFLIKNPYPKRIFARSILPLQSKRRVGISLPKRAKNILLPKGVLSLAGKPAKEKLPYILTQQNESYRSLAQDNAALSKAVNSRFNTKNYPDSPEDVVNYFEATFGDKIQFTDDARKSLKSCKMDLSDLWSALFALSTAMWDLYFTQGGDIYKEFKTRTGIKATRGEGTMTRADAKLMRQFVTDYNGESINIEAHITYAEKEQSIHFGFSDNDRKIIIGSCGEHKEIYSTRKRK